MKKETGQKRRPLIYKGYYYFSLYSMWRDLGKITYEAFRMRLSRFPGAYGYALGLEDDRTD